jgi:phosphoribosyl 1,2-cyclic phosphodiesterase
LANSDYIQFLGTAGSRWVVSKQLRGSGGIFLHIKGKRVLIDPGPGALVRCAEAHPPIDVTKLDALIVTHRHIDHCNDVNIIIDGMTGGGFRHRRGMLFAPRTCLDDEDPMVFKYVRGFLNEIVVTEPRTCYAIGDLAFATSAPHQHGTDTCGLLFDLEGRTLSFLVDTRYFPELSDAYASSDILVVNLTLYDPPESPKIFHLCLDDVRDVVRRVRPRRVVLTHFGLAMLQASPERVAAELAAELGVEVLAATDGLRVDV